MSNLFEDDHSSHLGHSDAVLCVTVSDDGALVLTGSADRTAKLWSMERQVVLHTFTRHPLWVYSVAFAHQCLAVCTACDDGLVRVWRHEQVEQSEADRQSGEDPDALPVQWILRSEFGGKHDRINRHALGVRSVYFSPDDATVVSAGADKSIKFWQLLDQRCASTLTGHRDWVTRAVLSPDGLLLASSSYDHHAKIWRVSDGPLPLSPPARRTPDEPATSLQARTCSRASATRTSSRASRGRPTAS